MSQNAQGFKESPSTPAYELGSVKFKYKVANKTQSVAVSDLLEAARDDILKLCRNAAAGVIFFLTNLLDFDDNDRLVVLDFLGEVKVGTFYVNKQPYATAFDAVLAAMVGAGDLDRARKAKLAALEAAAFFYPDALDLACDRIKQRMRDLGYKEIKKEALKKEAGEILKRLNTAAKAVPPGEAVMVKAVLPDAPVEDGLVVPTGWILSPTGVRPGDGEGLPTPLLIANRSQDTQRGIELLTLVWWGDGRWQSTVTERRVVANKNAIVELAGRGIPVYSGNAAMAARWLHDFLATNADRLPLTKVSPQMGWQGSDGLDGFLWGGTLITAEGEFDGTASSKAPVRFHGGDGGEDQLAAGFHKKGTLEGWVEAAGLVEAYPALQLNIAAALTPPLLPILDTDNFALDYAGPTSRGKTTGLKLAASVWGNPTRSGGGGTVLGDWNNTATWLERATASKNHLPCILDDTRTARTTADLANFVYTFTQGRSRGRGTKEGVAPQVGFRSVLISSGESALVSFTEQGGVRARVIEHWGSPLGGESTEAGHLAEQLVARVHQNYGHAGPRLVEFLVKHPSQWDEIRGFFAGWKNVYEGWAGNNAVARRMASHFAALTTAFHVGGMALDLPWNGIDPVEPLWDELTKETQEADRAAVALRRAVEWAVAHREHFYHKNCSASNQPHTGWAGRWDLDGVDVMTVGKAPWEWIGFTTDTLSLVFSDRFEFDATVKNWMDRGWLKVSPGRFSLATRINDAHTYVYAIKRSAIDGVLGACSNASTE